MNSLLDLLNSDIDPDFAKMSLPTLLPEISKIINDIGYLNLDYKIETTFSSNRSWAPICADIDHINIKFEELNYTINIPSYFEFKERLTNDQPFSIIRWTHGLWDHLYTLEVIRKLLNNKLKNSSASDDVILALANRICAILFPKIGAFANGFSSEIINDLENLSFSHNVYHSVAFKGYPTQDEKIFNVKKVLPSHLGRLALFTKYFKPQNPIYDSNFYKRWVISGLGKEIPDLIRNRNVILIANDLFNDLNCRWNLKRSFTHIQIDRGMSQRFRNQILERCREAINRTIMPNSLSPIVLFQAGSLAPWLISRLYKDYPNAFYIDMGQALNFWFMDKAELLRAHWMQVYKPVLLSHMQSNS